MAGGKWTAQNKKRPGVYINFVATPRPYSTISSRGIVAVAIPMSWGAEGELIELFGEDLINGNSLVKIGCTAADNLLSLPFRLALAGSYKALVFRADEGGTKAINELSENSLTVEAKYPGTIGNKLAISIIANVPEAGKYTVKVLFDGKEKESFIVTLLDDFADIESAWVNFVVEEEPIYTTIPEKTSAELATGADGTLMTDFTDFFELLDNAIWNCVAINTTDSDVADDVKDYITLMRDSRGKIVQGVVYSETPYDTEGILYTSQGFTTAKDTVSTDLFPLWVASITAGAAVNESNTFRIVEGATSIIDAIPDDEIENHLQLGEFVLSYRRDGAVVVEKDINSLHTFTADKGYAFSKNRVIRCLDDLGNWVMNAFMKNYAGKITNSSIGRNMFKTEIITKMDSLEAMGAIQNFAGASDIQVLPGDDIESVVVDVAIQPLDSMEKIYMTVNVDA